MTGKVEAIYIAQNRRDVVKQVDSATLKAGRGIVGDRYYGNSEKLIDAGGVVPDNHVTLIAKEELDNFLSTHESNLNYGDFRRNIITSGIDLNALVGKEFSVGDAICRGTELCEPCAPLSRLVHPAVLSDLVHKAGLRAVIVKDGEVEVGGEIT